MFRWLSRYVKWLSRYVKQINIYGVGIEIREIPEEEALPLLASTPAAASSLESAHTQSPNPIVERQDHICVAGTSPSEQRAAREIDLMVDGDGIQFHIHQPGGSQSRMWVRRTILQESLDRWKDTGGSAVSITVPGRTAQKDAQVVFVVDREAEVEVQTGRWWIWTPRLDFKAALEKLGIRVPW